MNDDYARASVQRPVQSQRTLARQETAEAELERLRLENARLRDTIVQLGSLVAHAHAQGFVGGAKPSTLQG